VMAADPQTSQAVGQVAPACNIGESERVKIERLLQQGTDPIIDTQIRAVGWPEFVDQLGQLLGGPVEGFNQLLGRPEMKGTRNARTYWWGCLSAGFVGRESMFVQVDTHRASNETGFVEKLLTAIPNFLGEWTEELDKLNLDYRVMEGVFPEICFVSAAIRVQLSFDNADLGEILLTPDSGFL
jgi:hypothetical protein